MHRAPLPQCLRIKLSQALDQPQALVTNKQMHSFQPAFLRLPPRACPASLVFLRPLGHCQHFSKSPIIHADSHQQRDIPHLAAPDALLFPVAQPPPARRGMRIVARQILPASANLQNPQNPFQYAIFVALRR